MKVLAGIVLFNPDIERLTSSIQAIIGQVDQIVLFDNSTDKKDLSSLLRENKIVYLSQNKNLGIGGALNQMFHYAQTNEFDWVLTLDQDSICQPGLIEHYLQYTNLENVGALTCNIVDRNFEETKITPMKDLKYRKVDTCITSGSFNSVEAYTKSDGFDESLFIDCVDFDYCYNLRKHGYNVYQINFDGLLHELGRGKNRYFFNRKITILNEPVFRHYYIARNHFYLQKKYPDYLDKKQEIKDEIHQWIKIILYEENKLPKLKERIRGIKDSKTMN